MKSSIISILDGIFYLSMDDQVEYLLESKKLSHQKYFSGFTLEILYILKCKEKDSKNLDTNEQPRVQHHLDPRHGSVKMYRIKHKKKKQYTQL